MPSEPYAPPAAPLGNPTEPPVAPRRWWIAGILGLLSVGLGQVYVGKAARGIGGFFLFLTLIFLCGALLVWGPAPRLTLVLFLLPAVLFLYLWVDAIRAARRSGASYRPRRYNRWYVYLAGFLLAQWITSRAIGVWKANFAESFYIPSGSMEPTLQIGDHLYVDKRRYLSRDPERGDLVIFAFPEKPSALAFKRVVGMPGDRLEIRDKQLFVNGQRHPEPYAVHNDPTTYKAFSGEGRQRDQASAVVPAGHYYLLGDNRDFSYDSRFFGPVPREGIKLGGRMVIYWSRAPETGVRWDRIGRVLDGKGAP